jgi:hypothetical protein
VSGAEAAILVALGKIDVHHYDMGDSVSLGRVEGVQMTLGLIVVIKECNCCLYVSSHCVALILLLFGVVVVGSRMLGGV